MSRFHSGGAAEDNCGRGPLHSKQGGVLRVIMPVAANGFGAAMPMINVQHYIDNMNSSNYMTGDSIAAYLALAARAGARSENCFASL